MAEEGQEKSRGLKFAERQLLRHGWEHGKGLGRDENGISEAIKVKVKCDKGGVGHKEGDQFTFHWWDHVFNKTSSSLHVESDRDGTTVRKSGEDDGSISNKKPLRANLAKEKLYGAFVRSATLVSGQEQSVDEDTSSISSDEDETKLDLSTTTKLSDAQLMKACGGRTAHKGARHGLKMSAKLARLEQQEAEFMAKYGKKTQPQTDDTEERATSDESKKRKKKEQSKDRELPDSNSVMDTQLGGEQGENKVKRKKKKNKDSVLEEAVEVQGKVKKKKKLPESLEENVLKLSGHNNMTLQDSQDSVPSKKKKKKAKD